MCWISCFVFIQYRSIIVFSSTGSDSAPSYQTKNANFKYFRVAVESKNSVYFHMKWTSKCHLSRCCFPSDWQLSIKPIIVLLYWNLFCWLLQNKNIQHYLFTGYNFGVKPLCEGIIMFTYCEGNDVTIYANKVASGLICERTISMTQEQV